MSDKSTAKGYTKQWEDEIILADKAQKCLDSWEMTKMGIFRESEFITERNALYRILLRICERDLDLICLSHPLVQKVKKIVTTQDKNLKQKIVELLNEADVLNDMPPTKETTTRAKNLSEQAEKLSLYLKRPDSLCDIFKTKAGKIVFVKNDIDYQ